MKTAFVLGNGLSRQEIDLGLLQNIGTIYGCNALYRDFTPDVLVATDRPIAETIQKSGYSNKNKFYTRNPLSKHGALAIPKDYWSYSSGPAALALAAEHGHEKVYLIGFDMGPTGNNRFNNVYADTEFYKSSQAVPTYTGNWIQQIVKVANRFDKTKFVRVCGMTTAKIREFGIVANLQHVTVADFLEQLNTG